MAETKRLIEPPWCWMCLLGLAINVFIIEGYWRSYGLLYLELLHLFSRGPQMTGLMQTTFSVSMFIASIPIGWLADRYSARLLSPVACVIGVAGAVILSLAPSIEVCILAYGVFLGCSSGLIWSTSMTTLSKLFIYNRPMASGLMFAGGSVGSMVYPIFFRLTTDAYTVRGALLLLGAIQLHFLVLPLVLRKPYLTPEVETTNIVVGAQPQERNFHKEKVYFISSKSLDEYKTDKLKDGVLNFAFDEEDHRLRDGKLPILKRCQEKRSQKANCVDSPAKPKDEQRDENKNGVPVSATPNCARASPVDKEESNVPANSVGKLFNCLASFRMLLTKKFLLVVLYVLLYAFSYMGFSMYMPAYASELGVSDLSTSILLTMSAVANLLGRLVVGALANLPCTNMYALAFTFTTCMSIVNIVFPMLLSITGAYWSLVGQMVALGLIGGAITPLMVNLTVNAVGVENIGKGNGVTAACFSISGGVPPLVFGALWNLTGSYQPIPLVTGITFFISGLFLLIALIYSRILEKAGGKTSYNFA